MHLLRTTPLARGSNDFINKLCADTRTINTRVP